MPAKQAVAVARPARERISVELLDADRFARRVYVDASERVLPALGATKDRWRFYRRRRADHAPRPLTDVAEDIVKLWNAGATEADLRPFEYFVRDVIDSCSAGVARRSLAVVDREEQQLEGVETTLTVARLTAQVEGAPLAPDALEQEADIGEREAAVQLEKSRLLRREAQRVRAGRAIPFPSTRAVS